MKGFGDMKKKKEKNQQEKATTRGTTWIRIKGSKKGTYGGRKRTGKWYFQNLIQQEEIKGHECSVRRSIRWRVNMNYDGWQRKRSKEGYMKKDAYNRKAVRGVKVREHL